MRGYTHIAGSILLLTVLPPSLAVIGGLVLGSVLPDIEAEGSLITKILPRIPVEHRTITHSILALAVVSAVASFFSVQLGLGIFLGYLSHLFLDSMNPTGVPFFYPFKKNKYRFMRIATGSFFEGVLLFSLLIIDIFVLFKAVNKFL